MTRGIVNADGTELRQLAGSDLWPLDAHWSPDGSLIVFRREEIVPNIDPDAVPVNVDVLSIRPELWIMDADGGSQAQIRSTRLADLAAVGCIACPHPASGGGTDAMWQPTP